MPNNKTQKEVKKLLDKMNNELYEAEKNFKEVESELSEKFTSGEISEDDYKTQMAILKGLHENSLTYIKSVATASLYEDYKYNMTTDDIAALLDLEIDYVSRNIRKYIDNESIPTGLAFKVELKPNGDIVKYIDNMTALRRVELTKKKFLFSEDSVRQFLKEHLFEVQEIQYYNISELKEEFTQLDITEIKEIALEFISKETKKLDSNIVEKNIDDNMLNLIMNRKIELLKSNSFETLIKHKLLYERYNKALTVAKITNNTEDKKYLLQKLKEIRTKRYIDVNDLKMPCVLHYKQIDRYINNIKHIKIHLKFDKQKERPIVLYAVDTNDHKLYDLEDEDNTIAVPVPLLLEKDFDKKIRNYIKKTIKTKK